MQFSELRELRKGRKNLKDMYKDTLAGFDEYNEIKEKIAELRNTKKQIELRAQEQMGRAWEKIQDLDAEIKMKKEMINDAALNDLMSGTTVLVTDEWSNEYEPEWKVNFKKSKFNLNPKKK